MGRKDEEMQIRRRATVLIQQALDVNPHDARARYMGAANFATMGDRVKAIEWADLALRSSSDEPMVYYNAACTFAVLDESERALELLERAMELGWGDRTWMESDSDLKSLRTNPRFRALLARLH
jgi:adenylate cyclase